MYGLIMVTHVEQSHLFKSKSLAASTSETIVWASTVLHSQSPSHCSFTSFQNGHLEACDNFTIICNN